MQQDRGPKVFKMTIIIFCIDKFAEKCRIYLKLDKSLSKLIKLNLLSKTKHRVDIRSNQNKQNRKYGKSGGVNHGKKD